MDLISDLDQWNAQLQSVCGPFETRPRADRGFFGRLGMRHLGDTGIADIDVCAQTIFKPRRALGRTPDDYAFLILQVEGEAVLAQDGNEAHLRPGDFTLIDSRHSCNFSFAGPMHQISCHLPLMQLCQQLGPTPLPRAVRFTGNAGAGSLISSYVRHIHARAGELDREGGRAACDALYAMLRNLLCAGEAGVQAGGDLFARIQAFIERHLDDPDLDVDAIAREHGVSRRTLYRLFAETGLSPYGWLWERRLRRARELLKAPAAADMHITDIAFQCGFNDSSHFTRRFKERFGAAPSSYRAS